MKSRKTKTCKADGCTNKFFIDSESGYCGEHRCCLAVCFNYAPPDSVRCDEHKHRDIPMSDILGDLVKTDLPADAVGHIPVVPAQSPRRIYICGAHSTGKTTVARWIAEHYKLPLVTEVARAVLAEMEVDLKSLRVDLKKANNFQKAVFERQIKAERDAGDRFVSDRAFDNLAYMAEHGSSLCSLRGPATDYINLRIMQPDARVIFLRPQRELLHEDGTRASVDWESVTRLDGMMKFMLEWFGIQYLAINTASMQERTRAIEALLGWSVV